jgi:integrase
MPSPELINGRFYLRLHVPNDVAQNAQGKTLHIPVADKVHAVSVGKVVKVSLRTNRFEEAKARFSLAYAAVVRQWDALRNGPVTLPHRTLVALAGQFYREIVAIVDEEPGETSVWDAVHDLHTRLDADQQFRHDWYSKSADGLLAANGLNADEGSKVRLIEELHRTSKQWAALNYRKAQGDYRPDPDATRFPPLSVVLVAPPTSEPKADTLTLLELFELWEKDHLANGKSPRTVKDFKQKVQSLIRFLGHEDALRVTSANISDWCEDLKHVQGIGARTVSQKYLSLIKLIYQIGFEKQKVKDNPAKDIKVRYTKPRKNRSSGFTDVEAIAILQATIASGETKGRTTEENRRAIRWLPWICAFTGARITEAAQLRTVDLIEEGGILCLRITPEAGSVKTGNYRIVPLHPQLLDIGLPEMIRSLPPGPIFYHLKPFRGVAADPVERAQNAGAKVGEWVRKVVKITDTELQPNHAWRHRFKTVAREVGMDGEIRDAIQGHEDGRAASDYGEVTIKAMWNALQALPRYDVTTHP